MAEEKQKSGKRYETEWSFSFEHLADSINKALGSLGEEVIKENFTVSRDAAQSARIVIGGSVGRTSITTLEGTENLLEADVAHLGEMEFSVSGESEKVITLKPKKITDVVAPIRRAIGQLGKHQDLYLRIRISPNVPLRLELDGGVGPAEFDLTTLDLLGLDIDGGVGPITLSLPTTTNPYKVELDGGVGGITVNAPAETHVRLDMEAGVGAAVLNIPAEASLDIKLEGGVGSTTINAAPGVAVHLEAEGGLGGISVPAGMKRLRADDDFVSKGGVWESAGFALANKRVNIRYDGGVGGFKLRQETIEIV